MTNGDRIRQMSNEELAEILKENGTCYWCKHYKDSEGCGEVRCIEGIKAYLESEEE